MVRRRGPHTHRKNKITRRWAQSAASTRHAHRGTNGPLPPTSSVQVCRRRARGASPIMPVLQHRGDELAPRRDRRNSRADCPRHPPGRPSRLSTCPRAHRPAISHHSAADEVPATTVRRTSGSSARTLALQPHLQILRRSSRPLLCGMEQVVSAWRIMSIRTAPMAHGSLPQWDLVSRAAIVGSGVD